MQANSIPVPIRTDRGQPQRTEAEVQDAGVDIGVDTNLYVDIQYRNLEPSRYWIGGVGSLGEIVMAMIVVVDVKWWCDFCRKRKGLVLPLSPPLARSSPLLRAGPHQATKEEAN